MILYHGSKEVVKYPEIERHVFIKIFISDFIAHSFRNRRGDGQAGMERKGI